MITLRNIVMITALCIVASACKSSSDPEQALPNPSLRRLVDKPHRYTEQTIVVSGYVLGTEFDASENDTQLFILVLGEKSRPSAHTRNSLIFADTKYKIRAAEDGFNREILKRCYIMAENARKLGLPITITGEFKPDAEFYYYRTGIDLFINQIKVGNETINTDYGDKSKLAHSTPGFLKKCYQGGKKLFNLIKKFAF